MTRWPIIRHIRWLVAVLEQDARCREWRKRAGGVPHTEDLETARIGAIWRGMA